MTRNNDRDRVGAIGTSHRAEGVGRSDASRQFAVRDGLAIRNIAELAPDAAVESRAFGRQRQIKLPQLAGEKGSQLTDGFAKRRRVFAPVRTWRGWFATVGKEDVAQANVIRRQQQLSGGA